MTIRKVTRRELIAAGGVATGAGSIGLALGIWYGRRRERWRKRTPPRSEPFSPSIYLAITEDDRVRIWVTKAEMGQGVMTTLAAIVADELDADWSRVEVVRAIGNANYGNMRTSGSSSVRKLFDELRSAGAAARIMIRDAAAEVWGEDPSTCETREGRVIHRPSGRRLSYGALALRAADREVPASPPLKARTERRLIGQTVPRVDIPAKVTGTAVFGVDVRLPGMLRAAVLHPPPGGELAGFEPERAEALDGVLDVVRLDRGLAVVASDSWSALEGAERVRVRWKNLASPPAVRERLELALERGGVATSASAPRAPSPPDGPSIERTYFLPYLAHAALEPINATAWVRDGGCEVHAPTQHPQGLQARVADHLGIEPARVVVHPTLLGGGFGRRLRPDETLEAVELSRRLGAPVQVVWSRAEDIRRDVYRPASLHQLQATVDAAGRPQSWRHAIASPSILGLTFEDRRVDVTATQGAEPLVYPVPTTRVEWCAADGLVLPLGLWRSVGHSATAFAIECFVDELAEAAGADPVAYRRALLPAGTRARAVLDRVADLSGWDEPSEAGSARGVAVHACFESVIAVVVEAAEQQGVPRLRRLTAAADCGLAVDPGNVRAQIEGGLVFGLSAALWGRIDLGERDILQSNFHDVRILRMDETPPIEVALIEGSDRPGGVGELAVPVAAPALANAWARLRGVRARDLPLAASRTG